MTRVVAGRLGGRRIGVPADGTRPTAERVREAVFNVLDHRFGLHGAMVLDLFAGSGAMGIEALSRGAEHARFVESDRRAMRTLRTTLADLDLGASSSLAATSVHRELAHPPARPYHLVMADPPYATAHEQLPAVLGQLVNGPWLHPDALVVLEMPASAPKLYWPSGLRELQLRRYGSSRVHLGVPDDEVPG